VHIAFISDLAFLVNIVLIRKFLCVILVILLYCERFW